MAGENPQAAETDPWEASFGAYRQALVDLNGDGVPDAAVPITNRERRDVQRRAMAGREPDARTQARLDADRPRLDENTSHLVRSGADIAANIYAPGTMAFLSGMAPTPAEAADKPTGLATPDQLSAEASANAARRAAEPNVLDQLVGMFKGRSFAPPDIEQFRQSRLASNPPPKALSETDYVAQQVDSFRKSPAYAELIKNGATKTAEARAAKIAENARTDYTSYTERTRGDLDRWNENIGREYENLKTELKGQEKDYNNQNFATRNPMLAAALTVGPLVGGAIAARKGFKGYNEQGKQLLEMAAKARASGDAAGELAAQRALETWKNSDYYTTIAKNAGKVAGGSVAGRGFMDMSDRYLMPEGSGARDAVKKKFTVDNLPNIAVEYGLNAMAGLEAPAIGAMMTKGGPRSLVNAEIARLAPSFYDDAAKLATSRQAALQSEQPIIALTKQNEGMAAATPPQISYAPQQVQLPPPALPPNGIGFQTVGNATPLPVQQPVNLPAQVPNPPPTPLPLASSPRVGYGSEKQALVRPYIESEVAAGRNVPALSDVENVLTQGGVSSALPRTFPNRLGNVQTIVDSLRQSGKNDFEIAQFIRSAMDAGISGLPVVAGGLAVNQMLQTD